MGTKSLLMAMAALTIAGCSQNEVTEINPDADRTIGLDVYTGVQTRGTETTTSTLKEADAGFGIFAYKTSKEGWDSEKASTTPDFMYNEHATWTSGSWGYASLRFWPTNDDKITFFAYAPYESNPGEGTDQKIILSAQSDKEAPKIVIVTTAYHVFRALILAKQQGLKCVGFGAKTKWYFTLNALIREFVGYLRLTWKKHALVIGIVASIVVATNIAGWLR